MEKKNNGLLLVAGAYFIWGLLPGYWKQLSGVAAIEVLSHRVVWSAAFLGFILASQGKLLETFSKLRDKKSIKVLCVSTLLISLNWLMYVWALGKGHFIEAGLGYYICPLVTLTLGYIVLGEELDRKKQIAIAITALGVLLKVVTAGHIPLIALTLAFSFSLYTMVRKTAAIAPLEGLFIETILVAVPALCYIVYLALTGQGAFMLQGEKTDMLLLASGIITALPLLMLVSGAPQISLQTVGVLQFIAPTLTVLVGVWHGDLIPVTELPAYFMIWAGILVYILPAMKRLIYRPALNF